MSKQFLQLFKKHLAQFAYAPRAGQLIWAATGRLTLLWLAVLLVQGVLPVSIVYLTRSVVDHLVQTMAAPGDATSLHQTLGLVGLMAGLMLLSEALASLLGWVRTAQAERVHDHISGLIHAQAAMLDLAFYEDATYHDRLHRARVDAVHRPVALLEGVGSVLQNSVTLVALVQMLRPLGWWLPLLMLGSTLPALYMLLRHTLHQHAWRLRTTTDRRRLYYYDWLLTLPDAAAELRLFALSGYFQQAFQTLRRRLRTERLQLARTEAGIELSTGALGLVSLGLGLLWMVGLAGQGQVTLGSVALFYQAFSYGQRVLRTLLTNGGDIYNNCLFLENLFEFLALEKQIVDPAQPVPLPAALQTGIHFDRVSFRYPGSPQLALDNFSLFIPAGKIVAVVGANGAGKSTLLKLLCRFYEPEAGAVLLDQLDLRAIAQADLWRRITVLFQQPLRFHATVAENIGLGDWLATSDAEQLAQVAQAAGADGLIAQLPQAYATVLGKWFGGTELSGGQWQRLALARAFLRQAPIMLLDEPTSALDAWSEADWMARLRTLLTLEATQPTVILITHRFTTAMQADMIHVMENGQIVESGAHPDLLAREGRYAQAWWQQMQPLPGGTFISTLGENCNGTKPITRATMGVPESRMDSRNIRQPNAASG